MIHEVILALLSKPSSSIFHSRAVRERLHPSENVLLDRVLDIAANYTTLTTFINKYTHPDESKDSTRYGGAAEDIAFTSRLSQEELFGSDEDISIDSHPGIYLQAFCFGLDKGLDPYRNDVVLLESKALHDLDSVTFTKVVSVAEKYADLFQILIGIITQIELRKIRGCALLSYIYRQTLTGSVPVVDVALLIFRECQLVFMDQLSRWLLLGHLADQHREFFISCDGEDTHSSMLETTELEISKTDGQAANKSSDAYLTCKAFNICYDALPSYIPHSIAQKILYVGKMIMLFHKDPKDVTKVGCMTRPQKFSIWGDEEEEYSKKLKAIGAKEKFDKILFEKTVSELHSTVIECTWKYFVVDTKLIEEIGLIKDFFLLGRGELFLEFLYKTDGIRKRPFVPSEVDQNCREAFVMAAHQVMYSNEAALKKFSIHFAFEQFKGTDFDLLKERDGWWHTLSLKYNITWPMHLIFKPAVLTDYNKMFNFLMRVKKAQRDLNEIWFDHKQSRTNMFSGTTSTSVWQLCNNLMFVVNNLQYYLQVDVLECQYTKLQSKLQASKDFEEILSAHTTFLANIMSQSFLWMRDTDSDDGEPIVQGKLLPMIRTLLSLLLLTDKFCKTFNKLSINQAALDKIRGEFEVTITVLLEFMGSMLDHPSGIHVSQLYLRLNYNDWFTTTLKTGCRV